VTAHLEARRLWVRHPRSPFDALRDATLGVARGEILALCGPNGSGKSTLMAALAGTLRPHAGEVRIDGVDLQSLGARERAHRLARLPQEPRGPDGLTVEALVAMGRYAHRGRFAGQGREDRAAVRTALEAVDLIDLRGRALERLSGGERRRAWLAMVLAQGAPLLLLDEPTAALDPRFAWEVLEHLVRIHRQRGTTIVLALHDLEDAARVADRIALLYRGRVYAVGQPKDVLVRDALRDVFGIDAEVTWAGRLRIDVLGPADRVRSL
jgi:iron complex transport system ATP-binding protein